MRSFPNLYHYDEHKTHLDSIHNPNSHSVDACWLYPNLQVSIVAPWIIDTGMFDGLDLVNNSSNHSLLLWFIVLLRKATHRYILSPLNPEVSHMLVVLLVVNDYSRTWHMTFFAKCLVVNHLCWFCLGFWPSLFHCHDCFPHLGQICMCFVALSGCLIFIVFQSCVFVR
jgi:hypothetical protein